MPYSDNASLPKGAKSLPEGQQTKWRKVFNAAYEGTCKDKGDKRDECASKIAWSQIDDKYKGKTMQDTHPIKEFSMMLKSVSHDRQKGTYRWKAVASDTDEDFYGDNMSMELFDDFINRITIKELAPEEFRSEFWQGGMPYLSVSHYPDLDGKAVPGMAEQVFVDGNQLRAYGQFNHSPLGFACYDSICKDLYQEPKSENPVRISIAFLDFGHIHKSNDYEFERKSIDDICPECLKENFDKTSGKIFKKGQLVHLALTRVPANERTSMEVDRAMTTRKEDATSIIGDELVEEIDKEAKLVGKSQALVIKSDEDEPEIVEEEVEEPVAELVEEAKKPMKDEEKEPMMEDDEDDEEEKPKDKKKKEMKSNLDERMEKIENLLSELTSKKPVTATLETIPEHELDAVFSKFKSAYDEIKVLPTTSDDKLHQLQEYFNPMVEEIRSKIGQDEEPEVEQEPASTDIVQALSLAMLNAMKPVSDKLDLLLTQRADVVKSATENAIPVRRSLTPTLSMQQDISPLKQKVVANTSSTPKLSAWTRKSVGLDQ